MQQPHHPGTALRQDEALREALLELERLRQREARALRENTALLATLSAMTRRDSPRAALQALLQATCESLGADAAAILRCRRRSDECVVEHCTDAALAGSLAPALAPLAVKPRRIADLTSTHWPAHWPALAGYRGLIAVPMALGPGPGAALVCLSHQSEGFGPGCLKLLGRIAEMALSALDKLELAERQALLSAVIEGSSASIAISDATSDDVPLIYVNPAFEALTGFGRTEVLDENCRLLAADPPDAPERKRLRGAVAERRRGNFLLRNRRKDGVLFWNQLDLDVVPGEGADARYLVATQIDVTARVEADDALRRLGDRLAAIAAVSDTWFWEVDARLRWTFLFDTVERVLGLRPEAMLGRRLDEVMGDPDYVRRGDWPALMASILSLEAIQGFTFRAPASAPRAAVIQVSGMPVFDREGRFAGYRGVAADVTEIIEAKEQAELASRAKSDFLATVSHELRTPLTAILGNSELLMSMASARPHQGLLAGIAEAGRQLDAVLSDVIDLSRLETGRVTLDPGTVRPDTLLDRAATLHRPAAAEKGLVFRAVGRGVLVAPRQGDAGRILQILHILLANAVKFTARGSVDLAIDATRPDGLRLEVSDTGIGIAPADQARIFDAFLQVDARVARAHGGAGLGLSICQGLVRLMDGRIQLDSAPGRGTTVRVWLPLPLVAPTALPQPRPGADSRPLAGLSLLVADDNAANRKILSLMLRRLGADCTVVPDGAAALAAWQERVPDIGLFDINMPGMDGLDLIAHIRAAEPPHHRLPALAVTANAMPEQIARYLAAGFDGCLAKPFTRESLLDAIWQLTARGLRRDVGLARPA